MSRPAYPLDVTLPWLAEALLMETDDCIEWPFSVQSRGYGKFWDGEEYHLAHAYICTQVYGPRPSVEHDAAHSCVSRRRCCNYRHLRWALHHDNLEDRRAHGTLPMGEAHVAAVLTEPQVIAIRASTATQAALAQQFGVHVGTIQAIKDERSWKHLL